MINVIQSKRFCKEDISKIENYDKAVNDKSQTWHCHHRTEIWWNCSKKELIENECYYGRKACELIFLTPKDHISLHKKGKAFSEEHKRKIRQSHKGMTGKFHSTETKVKMKEREHKKSAFYQKFGMTIEEYKKYNNISFSCTTIWRMFKKGEI